MHAVNENFNSNSNTAVCNFRAPDESTHITDPSCITASAQLHLDGGSA